MGLTGAAAFEALLDALRHKLGDGDTTPHPVAVEALLDLPMGQGDLVGLAYERFFSDLFKGLRGQFFTPQPLIELVLSQLPIGPGTTVMDPTCGSGGFLVAAGRRGAAVRGVERDPYLVALARLNLRLAGMQGQIEEADWFAAPPRPVDVIVANPPFSVEVADPAVLARYELADGRARMASDALFAEAIEGWVRPGGLAGIVMPYSVLVNPSYRRVRERLDAAWERTGVCSLPEGVFRPFGGAAGRACVLWLRRRGAGTGPVRCRWAELADPGYDVRSKHHRPTDDTEILGLMAGQGWRSLAPGAWVPVPDAFAPGVPSRPLQDLAEPVTQRPDPKRAATLVELADVDKATGEVTGARAVTPEQVRWPKVAMARGDVLVSRLRPELNNVAVVPSLPAPVIGSTEWVVLRPLRLRYFLLLSMRTPAWRRQLPVTSGQTRPRTAASSVHATRVAWPGEEVASRIDALAGRLLRQRALALQGLRRLQRGVEAYGAGEIDAEALAAEVDAVRAAADQPGLDDEQGSAPQ